MAGHTALVLGATGLIGGHCLQRALECGRYERVVVIARRPVDIEHPRLDQRIGDLGSMAELARDLEVQDLFCCLGTTIRKAGSQAAFRVVDHDLPLLAAQTFQAQGLQHYLLVSAMGANAGSMIFYNRVKGELENALQGLGLPALSIFRPSLLLGEREEHRPGEALGARLAGCLNFAMQGPLRHYAAIEGAVVAQAMLARAAQPASGVRTFLSGDIAALARG